MCTVRAVISGLNAGDEKCACVCATERVITFIATGYMAVSRCKSCVICVRGKCVVFRF